MLRSSSFESPATGSLFSGQNTTDGSSGLRISGFLPHSHPLRRSVTDNYYPAVLSPGYSNTFPDASTFVTPSSSPPAYEDAAKLPPSRFKILPREEEGHEELPGYTCSLHKEAVFDRKPELRSPFERASRRRWEKCYFVLHGTKLEIYKPKRKPFFADVESDSTRPIGWIPGTLLGSYTMQLAEVGTATDYRKRHFVIRLRVQTEQFLLSCRTIESFLDWLEALSAAIDLSPSLEERSLPRYQTLPRRRRRRPPGAAPSNLLPHAPATAFARPDLTRQLSHQESIAARSDIEPPPPPPLPLHIEEEEEEFDAAGKWAPRTAMTREANLRYARRCMAVLCADAPRQSDFVVVRGKRFRLLWEAKTMIPDAHTRDEPQPAIMAGKGKGKGKGVLEEEEVMAVAKLPRYEEVFAGRFGVITN